MQEIRIGGRPPAQSQERLAHAAAQQAGGHDRRQRLGQVVARLRHALRRGPAPLRREPLHLRAPVPRADGKARGRFHRGPFARHRHRAAHGRRQPALDHLDHDGNPRFPAPALRASRPAASSRNGQAAAALVGAADGRPRADREGGHADPDSRARRAGPEGRVPRRGRKAAARRLRPRAHRRQAWSSWSSRRAWKNRRAHVIEARGRPAQDQRHDPDAPDRFDRTCAQDRRRASSPCSSGRPRP